jgi:hypothetical protein
MPVPGEKAKEQPRSAGESGQSEDVKPSVRETFEARLLAEREPQKGKPEKKERVKAQSSGPDDPDQEADEDEELEDPESEEEEEEESDSDSEEEQEEEESGVEALTVGDRQYTVEDVENLVKQNRELDADYRRKTQILARRRQEFDAKGTEYEQIGGMFQQLTRVNLQNLENVNPESLTQEQFGQWRTQMAAAKAGAQQLNQMMEQVRKKVVKDREDHLDQQAAESAEILKSEFKERWGNEFYGKLRDYATKSGLYEPKEFSDITDWRVMKGVVALYDAEEAKKIGARKIDPKQENAKPTRRQLQRARRNKKSGQFQSTVQAVRDSPNARQDGTLRTHFEQKLVAERGKR